MRAATGVLPFTAATDRECESAESVVLEAPSDTNRPCVWFFALGDTNWRDDGALPSGDQFTMWLRCEHEHGT